jgi:hypothetical protein
MRKSSIHNNKASAAINVDYIFTPVQDIVLRHFITLTDDISDNLCALEILYKNLDNMISMATPNSNNFDVLTEEIGSILNNAREQIDQNCYQAIIKFTTPSDSSMIR